MICAKPPGLDGPWYIQTVAYVIVGAVGVLLGWCLNEVNRWLKANEIYRWYRARVERRHRKG